MYSNERKSNKFSQLILVSVGIRIFAKLTQYNVYSRGMLWGAYRTTFWTCNAPSDRYLTLGMPCIVQLLSSCLRNSFGCKRIYVNSYALSALCVHREGDFSQHMVLLSTLLSVQHMIFLYCLNRPSNDFKWLPWNHYSSYRTEWAFVC